MAKYNHFYKDVYGFIYSFFILEPRGFSCIHCVYSWVYCPLVVQIKINTGKCYLITYFPLTNQTCTLIKVKGTKRTFPGTEKSPILTITASVWIQI